MIVNYLDNLKQNTLVSGTNIKTINGNSLLGSGDIEISGFLPLTGGAVTGQVNFTDTVSLLDATVGDLLVTGQASFVNKASLTNATVGSLSITGTGTVATNTNYTNIQLRNIFFSTAVPASATGNNGDICIVYA